MLQTSNGRPVLFVADPSRAPLDHRFAFARPDDLSETGETWREQLVRYNRERPDNPLGLLPASDLYARDVYRKITNYLSPDRTFILSAGWGLIAASFLTPAYDITFSASAEPYKKRKKKHRYADLSMLPTDIDEPICFLGGKDYVPLFCSLTRKSTAPRFVFYNAMQPPEAPGCDPVRYVSNTRTNWHYECATALLDGKIPWPA